jgi:hypothetical protein
MNKFETKVLEKLEEILKELKKPILTKEQAESLIISKKELEDCKKLELEDFNFRINSDGWKRIASKGLSYLENTEGDIWESIDGCYAGEQFFTWNAAMRETKKAGKRTPTDKEFSILLKTKEDMKNLIFSGFRSFDGSFYGRAACAYFWSSSQGGADAWGLSLGSSDATVGRREYSKVYGFSVRCLED